jgi:hypothetical protein
MMCTTFIYVLLASPVAFAMTNLLLLHWAMLPLDEIAWQKLCRQ